jgi:hypothetical protein
MTTILDQRSRYFLVPKHESHTQPYPYASRRYARIEPPQAKADWDVTHARAFNEWMNLFSSCFEEIEKKTYLTIYYSYRNQHESISDQ